MILRRSFAEILQSTATGGRDFGIFLPRAIIGALSYATWKNSSVASLPRPAEIPLNPKISNTVDLIGRVGLPIHVEMLPLGAARAVAVLEVKGASDYQQLSVPLIFEGLLAEIAACHVKENDLIHVSGKLSADSPQIIIDDHESTVKVLAQSLNFIETKPQDKEVQPFTKELDGVQLSDNAKDSNPTLACWNKFLANPGDWLDNRKHKTKRTQPDFEHKSRRGRLWINKSTPVRVLLALKSPTFCEKLLKITEGDIWKDLVNNPNKWWDDRLNKRNPKAPDFKHKETGKGLWLDSSPDWVRAHYSPGAGLTFSLGLPLDFDAFTTRL